MFREIKASEVKTRAEVNRYLEQKCGDRVAITTSLALFMSLLGFSYLSHKWHVKPPALYEYKLAFTTVTMLTSSLLIGKYFKEQCEKEVKEEFKDLFA